MAKPSTAEVGKPAEIPAPKGGELVTPSHGHGKLRRGSQKGGKGGTGRPPSAIRATLRKAFDERIPLLRALADDEDQDWHVRLKAMDMLAKYGVGVTNTQTDDDGKAIPPHRIDVTLVRRSE